MSRHARSAALALAALALTACTPAAPVGGPTAQGGVPFGAYYLVGIGQDAVPMRNATMVLAEGLITGQGPCGPFSAQNSAALPAIAITAFIGAPGTCIDAALERRYFAAIQQATGAVFNGGVLTMQGPTWLQFEPGVPSPTGAFNRR